MNPRTTAIISAIGIALAGFSMLSSSGEAPSPAVATLESILLACGVIGLVGSLVRMSRSG